MGKHWINRQKEKLFKLFYLFKKKVEAYNIANTDTLEEICKFNKNFVKYESEINLVKEVNTLLNKKVVDVEGQCRANAQYSRRECLEVVGIPRGV